MLTMKVVDCEGKLIGIADVNLDFADVWRRKSKQSLIECPT